MQFRIPTRIGLSSFVSFLLAFVCLLLLASEASSPREAVKARNSLLAQSISQADVQWDPSNVPENFRWETHDSPDEFSSAVASLHFPPGQQLDHAIMLARHISPSEQRGDPIQSSTIRTYQSITTRGNGYCADYTQVFNGIAHVSNLPVREWGVSFDGFGGDGHAFNEIYSDRYNKWIMIDSFYSFYPVDADSRVPLSAIEFRDRLGLENPLDSMAIEVIDRSDFGFSTDERLVRYFRRGVDQFYLWLGNNVFEYDEHPVVAAASRVSRSAEQLVAILVGVHPRIGIVTTDHNSALVAQLKKKKLRIIIYVVAGSVAGGLGLLLGAVWLTRRFGPPGQRKNVSVNER